MRLSSIGKWIMKFVPWGIIIILAIPWVDQSSIIIDQAVTIGHQHQQYIFFERQLHVLWHITSTLGKNMSEEQIINLLLQEEKIDSFYKEDDQLIAGEICFRFKDNKLVYIDLGDDEFYSNDHESPFKCDM